MNKTRTLEHTEWLLIHSAERERIPPSFLLKIIFHPDALSCERTFVCSLFINVFFYLMKL